MEKPVVDDAAVAIETKITAPITWISQSKFKIQDLRKNQHEEVLTLIKVECFCMYKSVCKFTRVIYRIHILFI